MSYDRYLDEVGYHEHGDGDQYLIRKHEMKVSETYREVAAGKYDLIISFTLLPVWIRSSV